MGRRAGLDISKKTQISCPCLDSNYNSSVALQVAQSNIPAAPSRLQSVAVHLCQRQITTEDNPQYLNYRRFVTPTSGGAVTRPRTRQAGRDNFLFSPQYPDRSQSCTRLAQATFPRVYTIGARRWLLNCIHCRGQEHADLFMVYLTTQAIPCRSLGKRVRDKLECT